MENFISQYNRLTNKLFRWLYSEKKDVNYVFSPLSVICIMALGASTTAGDTRKEIEHILCGNITPEQYYESLKLYLDHLAQNNSFSLANCVCVDSSLNGSINSKFEDCLRKRFDGKLFSAEDLNMAVNAWVEEKTHGMIKEFLSDPPEEKQFRMGSAVSFEDEWAEEYDEKDVIHEEFTNSDGSKSKVRMLKSCEKLYVEDEYWEGFLKPYKRKGFSFMAVISKDQHKLLDKDIIGSVDIAGLCAGKETISVNVEMPEYIIDSDYDLTERLKEMGVGLLFSEKADFSSFSDEWLKAEKVIHKAHIEVDRKGTKASAAGFIYGAAGNASFDDKFIWLTRPFLYAIVDDETGLPVFMGVVNHLEPNTENDGMTYLDRAKKCYGQLNRILCKLEPCMDDDGIIGDDTAENLYRKARKICMKADLKEMNEMEEVIDQYIEEYRSKRSMQK